jgi:hypothetical protein
MSHPCQSRHDHRAIDRSPLQNLTIHSLNFFVSNEFNFVAKPGSRVRCCFASLAALIPPFMKRGFPLLPVLLFAASAAAHAFTLDIAGDGIEEFGRSPRSISVPGYGEVTFESGLDGALVVDSAYASNGEINFPPVATSVSKPQAAVTEVAEYVEISSRSTVPATDQPAAETDRVAGKTKPPEGLNSVPETASAALGLLGILLFLLRRWR